MEGGNAITFFFFIIPDFPVYGLTHCCSQIFSYSSLLVQKFPTVLLHCVVAIYLDRNCCDLLFGLTHRPYVLKPQRFEGWFFPRHQVKPTLLVRSIELASIGRHGVPSTLAIHSSCAKIWLWVTEWRDNIKIIIALLSHSLQVLYLGKRAIIVLILSLHFVTHSQIFAQLECMARVLSVLSVHG
jgi:hypothetical protein